MNVTDKVDNVIWRDSYISASFVAVAVAWEYACVCTYIYQLRVCYESVGPNTEQTKVSSQDLLYVANSPSLDTRSERTVRAVEVCDSGESEREAKAWNTNYVIQHSSNITKWMSESMERITRDTRDRAE